MFGSTTHLMREQQTPRATRGECQLAIRSDRHHTAEGRRGPSPSPGGIHREPMDPEQRMIPRSSYHGRPRFVSAAYLGSSKGFMLLVRCFQACVDNAIAYSSGPSRGPLVELRGRDAGSNQPRPEVNFAKELTPRDIATVAVIVTVTMACGLHGREQSIKARGRCGWGYYLKGKGSKSMAIQELMPEGFCRGRSGDRPDQASWPIRGNRQSCLLSLPFIYLPHLLPLPRSPQLRSSLV